MAKCERHGEYHEDHGCGVAVTCDSGFAHHDMGCHMGLSYPLSKRPAPVERRTPADYAPWEAPAGNCPRCWHEERKDEMAKLQRDAVIEVAAKAAHEANRVYCKAIGDDTQLPWDEAPRWQRDSCIKGVRFVLANRGSTPVAQHESWLQSKFKDGWVYGETKDAGKKTHPCMVPYGELPESQRAKDLLFVTVVASILAHHQLLPS